MRANHDCTLDKTFNGTGIKLFDFDASKPDQFTAVDVDSTGNLIIGGNSGGQALLAKTDSSGGPAPSFAGGVIQFDVTPGNDGVNGISAGANGYAFAGFAGQDSLYGLLQPTGSPAWPGGPYNVVDNGGIDFYNDILLTRENPTFALTVGTSILDGKPRGVVVLFDPLTGNPLSDFNGGAPQIVDQVRTGISDLLSAGGSATPFLGFRDNEATQSFDFMFGRIDRHGLVNVANGPFALVDFHGVGAPRVAPPEDQTPVELGKRLGSTKIGNNEFQAAMRKFGEATRVVMSAEVIGDDAHGAAKKSKKKVFVLGAKDYVAKPGKTKTLKFKLAKDTKKYLRSERGKKVTVKLAITTVDVIGNTKTFNRTKHVRIPRRLHF
jgi:hypothetical protein